MFGIQCMRALKTHEKLTQIRREREFGTREPREPRMEGLEFENCGLRWVGREKNLGLRQTPPHSGFRELISGLDDLQRSLAPATLAFKRFRLFLFTFFNDHLWLEWKRRFRWDLWSFGLGRALGHERRNNRYR